MNKLILYVCAWICLHSCGFSKSQEESMLEYALSQAGDNRKELEYVIKYYEGDSLKREAARFLIRNMVYHFGYEKRERVSDITTLSSDYLIRNIELCDNPPPNHPLSRTFILLMPFSVIHFERLYTCSKSVIAIDSVY